MQNDIDSEASPGGFNWKPIALALLRGWKFIAVGLALGFVVAVIDLHSAHRIYATRMVLTSVHSTVDESPSSSRISALGGLASLAGLSMPANQSASQFMLFVDALHSRLVADQMAKDPALLKKMFRAEWDADSQTWQQPEQGFGRMSINWLRSVLGFPAPPWTPPGGAQVAAFIHANVQVVQEPRKTYLVTVEMNSASPQFAIYFLQLLDRTADNDLRQDALTRSREYIDYLTHKLNSVTVSEHREAIMNSLSEQEKYSMVASSAAPFAADMFDPPNTDIMPVAPVAKTVILTNMAIFGAIGAALVLAMYFGGAWLAQRLPVERLPRFLRETMNQA